MSNLTESINIGDTFYRYRDTLCGYSEDDGYTVNIYCTEYVVVSVTNCGAWIDHKSRQFTNWKKSKFVLLNNKRRPTVKRWAHPTRETAMESFIARKLRQKLLLELQLDRVNKALAKVEVTK